MGLSLISYLCFPSGLQVGLKGGGVLDFFCPLGHWTQPGLTWWSFWWLGGSHFVFIVLRAVLSRVFFLPGLWFLRRGRGILKENSLQLRLLPRGLYLPYLPQTRNRMTRYIKSFGTTWRPWSRPLVCPLVLPQVGGGGLGQQTMAAAKRNFQAGVLIHLYLLEHLQTGAAAMEWPLERSFYGSPSGFKPC